jgi:mannose-6-phosphate isomerase-like protein (cupin superfamily)
LFSLDAMMAQMPGAQERGWVSVPLTYGSLMLGVYAPRGEDPQQPHDQDEVYVVMRGTGSFVNGSDRKPFGPGDLLFVPAGVVHRFENLSDDLALWVVFYGPDGGENP